MCPHFKNWILSTELPMPDPKVPPVNSVDLTPEPFAPESFYYFRSSFSVTQSPGARSYFQKVQPLQERRLHAAAPAKDGDK